MKNCCDKKCENGAVKGLIYGVLPHSFCILFIILSIAGSAFFVSLLRPLLMSSSFFYLLIFLSFVIATISAFFYLKRSDNLSFSGLMSGRKYLAVLYGTTMAVNMVLFLFVFPVAANVNSGSGLRASIADSFWADTTEKSERFFWAEVDIPCSGHSPLISGELRETNGVERVVFSFPNIFKVEYDPDIISKEEILALDIFNTFPIEVR